MHEQPQLSGSCGGVILIEGMVMSRAGWSTCWLVAGFTLAMDAACRHDIQTPANPPAETRPPQPPPGGQPGVPGALVPPPSERAFDVEWGRVSINMARYAGVVTANAEMVHPKLWVFRHPTTAEKAGAAAKREARADAGAATGAPPPLADFQSRLRRILPAEMDRLAIFDGELVIVDLTQKDQPQLWLHDLAVSVENLATRRWLSEGRPILFALSGIVQNSGRLSVFVTADPFGKELNFAGRASLVGLQTRELFQFIDAATGLQAPVGTIDLFVEFAVQHGTITGGIKPVVNNLKIAPSGSVDAWKTMKVWMASAAIELTSNAVPGRNTIATVIPINGKVTDPQAQLWPTLGGILRNAFVEGISSSFAGVPPRGGP